MSSDSPPVVSKSEVGRDREVQVEVLLHGEVGELVGERKEAEGGDSRVGCEVEPAEDAPSDDLRDEKFVQGIGRKQSTAKSRTGESPVPSPEIVHVKQTRGNTTYLSF